MEERTIKQDKRRPRGLADPLEVDMRRRLFWGVMIMDYGLSHSLGRPAMLATGQDRIDVEYFAPVDDQYITPDGILPGPFSTRKWISIHFFKMRMLQLEIRRKLYQKKRPTPTNDSDPWFKQMHKKLVSWRDASPNEDEGSGFSRMWFIGRYNTMVVFLHRPSPQIPRPTPKAAMLCYDACEFNIYMQEQQIRNRSVEITWVFTQTIFMAMNTMLWCLSYAEVRGAHPREEVERHLRLALEEIKTAAARWPGVESAAQLYDSLIAACLQIYDKEGDILIMATSPNDASLFNNNGNNRSFTTTPSTLGRHNAPDDGSRGSIGSSFHADISDTMPSTSRISIIGSAKSPLLTKIPSLQSYTSVDSQHTQYAEPLFNPLPDAFDPYQWDNALFGPPSLGSAGYVNIINPDSAYAANPHNLQYDNFPDLWNAQGLPLAQTQGQAQGLTRQQQMELMQDLKKSGVNHLEMMIEQTSAFFNAGARSVEDDWR